MSGINLSLVFWLLFLKAQSVPFSCFCMERNTEIALEGSTFFFKKGVVSMQIDV